MGLEIIAVESVPATPSAGFAARWIDSTAKIQCVKNDAGICDAFSSNAAIAAQAGGFAADTYLTGSSLIIPSFGLQAKTIFTWRISASKTGAGVAQPVYIIRVGAGQAVTDTARLTLTGPAQTAIADIGTLNIIATVRSIGAAGVIQGTAWWDHTGTAASTTVSGTGFANNVTGHAEGTSVGFDMSTLAGQYVGLSINGGASAVWSPTQVIIEADW